MINFCEPLSWIEDHQGKNPLQQPDFDMARRMLNRHGRPSFRLGLANQLELLMQYYPEPRARALILIYLGIFYLDIGDCGKAVDRFSTAAALFHALKDPRSLSAALWLLGMGQREMGLYRLAFDRWKESRDLMIDLYHDAERLKVDSRKNGKDPKPGQQWYGDRIRDMTADLIRSPHDMFEWTYAGPDATRKYLSGSLIGPTVYEEHPRPSVYRFKRTFDSSDTCMGPSALHIRQRIDTLLENHKYNLVPDLYHELEGLNQIPPGKEFCEIHAFSASLSDYLPELKQEAIRHLESARCSSLLQSRARMIVSWMLGLMLIKIPERHRDAIRALEASIVCARRLRTQADHDNNKPLWQWYGWHADAMQQVLNEQVQAIL